MTKEKLLKKKKKTLSKLLKPRQQKKIFLPLMEIKIQIQNNLNKNEVLNKMKIK